MSSPILKLHLGCGEVHLDGYLNIDYPPTSHTVQTKSAADEYHDLLELSYPANFIEEIRLHHVFEHFPRAVALGLLAGWWSWLKGDGLLRIEVPDFERTARAMLNPLSSPKARFVGLRHIFGSQEAHWAVHKEGWSARQLRDVLRCFSYRIEKVDKNTWRGTYNVEIFARKEAGQITRLDFEHAARKWLSKYIVDDSPSELQMLDVWMVQYRSQVEKTSGKPW